MREYESFDRIGTMPHRSYYIPFGEADKVQSIYGIQDRTSSSRFISLDGIWQITQHDHVEDFAINEALDATIPVPSCVQMHGYDQNDPAISLLSIYLKELKTYVHTQT